MAEILLEPSSLSKIIPLSFDLNDTSASNAAQLMTKRQFNTADTDAWFQISLEGFVDTAGSFDITLFNLNDKSVFNHTGKPFTTNPFYYKLDSESDETKNEIRHAGRWIGQIVVTLANGNSATRKFIFDIEGHILDGADVQTIMLEDYNALIATINTSKDLLAQYNVDYAALLVDLAAAETARTATYNQLVADQQANIEAFDVALDDGIVAANLATKLQDFEATNNSRLLSAEQQLAEKALDAQFKDTVNAKVSQGVSTKRKPMLVITLDDGSVDEYTLSKPLMESMGVKPTVYYISSRVDEYKRMTGEQLKELYALGWEIGSHTRNHTFLAEISTPSSITAGASQLEIWNGATYKQINTFQDTTTTVYIYDGSGGTQSEVIEVTSVSEIVGGKVTLTFATQLKNSYERPVVRYSDDFMDIQFKHPIDFLNSLDIPCSHLAYPYGAMSPAAMELAAKHYASARGAFPINDGTTFSNGGIVRGTEKALMQYNILCGDLSNSTTSYIDTLLNQTVTEVGFAVLLGHGNVFDSWNTQFIYAVNKARELGIEIVTMGEALKCHGNLLDLGKDGFKISRSGLMRGNGINVLSPGKIDPSPTVWGFKEGWTFVRVETADALEGFPEMNGTYVYLRTSTGAEGFGWNPQYFYGKSGKIYTRNSITYNTHSPWVELRKGSVQKSLNIPTFDVGAGGTYHYATGIDVGTNYAVVIATSMSNNFIASLLYNNVFIATKMEAGMAYLSFVNRGAVTFSVPATTMNVEVIPK